MSLADIKSKGQADRSVSERNTRLYKFVKIAKLEGCSFVEQPIELNFAVDYYGAALAINNGDQGTKKQNMPIVNKMINLSARMLRGSTRLDRQEMRCVRWKQRNADFFH